METGSQEMLVNEVRFGRAATGTPMLTVMFNTIAGEPFPVDLWLTEKAAGQTRASLKAIGFDCDARSVQELADNPRSLRGTKATVDVEEEEWNGQSRFKGRIIFAPLAKKDLKAVDDILRGAKKHRDDAPVTLPPSASPLPTDASALPF